MIFFSKTQSVNVWNLIEKILNRIELNFGVPQSFTLGPLLFLFYINDFCKSLSNLIAIDFADGTTLYKEIDSSFDTINHINEELTQVHL